MFDHVQIGPASPEDAEGIRNVQRDTWLATYPNEEYGITREDILSKNWENPERVEKWKKIIGESGKDAAVWVAKDGASVVAFCSATKDETENRLRALYVLPAYQSKGIGAKLMERALAWFDQSKDTTVEVAKYNAGAISFYKRYGFGNEEDIPTSPNCELRTGKSIPEIRMIRRAR